MRRRLPTGHGLLGGDEHAMEPAHEDGLGLHDGRFPGHRLRCLDNSLLEVKRCPETTGRTEGAGRELRQLLKGTGTGLVQLRFLIPAPQVG